MTKTIQIHQAAKLFDRDWNLARPIVRLNYEDMRALGVERNSWVMITSKTSERKIYRMAWGSPYDSLPAGAVMLSYDDMLELDKSWTRAENETAGLVTFEGEQQSLEVCDWELQKCTKLRMAQAYWYHPDEGYRYSWHMAIAGLVIGLLGFLTGIISLI